MRRSLALTLIGLVAATPLAAQFEGTVTMKMNSDGRGGNGEMFMKIAVKDGKTAAIITMPAGSGPMAGMEMRSIYDPATNTSTMLMPMPPGMGASMPQMANAKGLKMVVDLSKADVDHSNDDATIKPLGTSEKVAGMSCDDYVATSKSGTTKMCVTSAMGRFVFPQTGGVGRRGGGAQAPAWTRAFGDKPVFPLKVWSDDGKMQMEVVAVDKGSVPASAFETPDGYVDMSAMMGGMRRPPE